MLQTRQTAMFLHLLLNLFIYCHCLLACFLLACLLAGSPRRCRLAARTSLRTVTTLMRFPMLPSICSTVSARFIFSSFIEMRKEFQVSHHNESPTSKSTPPCRLRFRRWPSSIFILTTAPRTVITHRSPRPLCELFFQFLSLSFFSNFTQHAL